MRGVAVRQVHSISYITFHLNNLQQETLKAQQLVYENSANLYAMSFVALKQIDNVHKFSFKKS
jgi:hypothetical protein